MGILVILPILLVALSGYFKAVQDTVLFHYETSIFKDRDPLFWDNTKSWENKNNFKLFGKQVPTSLSRTVLVFMTDAFHWYQFLFLNSFYIGFALIGLLSSPNVFVFIGAVITARILFGIVFEYYYSKKLIKKT